MSLKKVGKFAVVLWAALTVSGAVPGPLVCQSCHPKQVEAFSHYSMAHSLREPSKEHAGSFTNNFGTTFTTYSNEAGTWQRMEKGGDRSEYRVAYVIGSGKHAAGFLVRIGDHLFQSPIGYYRDRHGYGMVPGYEKLPDADFTRPITEECVLCHSGKPLHIAGTIAGYETPAFAAEAISCERCHGPTEAHVKRPVPGSIVNPANLKGAARDSICEQCHLSGLARVPNPGRTFADFEPGMRLEEVYSVYHSPDTTNSAFRVIGQSEQLRASACARNSNGAMWCGTCHDLHKNPANPVAFYRERCLSCHAGKLPRTHPAASSDCVSCHMPRRPTADGAHTVFTDHRILRRAASESAGASAAVTIATAPELVPWREPDPSLAKRNLALAYIKAGSDQSSPPFIIKGYRLLTEVQTLFPNDVAVFKAFGELLLRGNQPQEAKIAFDRALELDPAEGTNEENAGQADYACGNVEAAAKHLERALTLDPLLLPSIQLLHRIYQERGEVEKLAALEQRTRVAMAAH